jgi:hypothetical protein
MWTEDLHGDLKKHGFDLEITMLHDFLRLSRFTLAVAFLNVWLISIGGTRSIKDCVTSLIAMTGLI